MPPRPNAATAVSGFPPRAHLARRYAARTGRDLSHLDFYVAFNRWKTAAINHGVYARYMEGKKTTQGVDLDLLRSSIDASLTLSEQALARLGG
jgi:aminoglycoside phosphotransferase (APT) family kinase protein